MSALDLEECRRWLALPKWGEPREEWAQDRSHRGKVANDFGLVDGDGVMIPGVQAGFVVFRPPRIDPAWAMLDFRAAVERFRSTCHLTFSQPLPDPDALALR